MFRQLLEYAVTKQLLPSAYQQVEYIESTGTQYINTGIVPTNSTGYIVKHTICYDNSTDNILIGCRQDSGQTGYWTDVDWGYNDAIGWGFGSYSPKEPKVNGYRHYIEVSEQNKIVITQCNYLNSRICKVDNSEYPLPQETLPYISYPIYLFCANNYGNPILYIECKIFYAKISDGSSIIRYFIPCYRKSDNEIGLYDLVSKSFFTNQGSGNFNKGSNV